jgi:hypothetical protein
MWKYLSREVDLLELVNKLSGKDLLSLKKHLMDEKNTMLLRDSNVYRALQAIEEKMLSMDIKDIIDFFL